MMLRFDHFQMLESHYTTSILHLVNTTISFVRIKVKPNSIKEGRKRFKLTYCLKFPDVNKSVIILTVFFLSSTHELKNFMIFSCFRTLIDELQRTILLQLLGPWAGQKERQINGLTKVEHRCNACNDATIIYLEL